jgi:hypothetical protein
LFSATGIERHNKDKRQDRVLRGFRHLDALACVIVTHDRMLDGIRRLRGLGASRTTDATRHNVRRNFFIDARVGGSVGIRF